MLRTLFLVILLGASAKAFAAPFLTCDPYPASTTDPNLNVVSFVITFSAPSGINPVTVQAQVGTSGDRQLFYDVGPLANATYTVTAAAVNGYALEGPPSSPFTFSKGSPATPTGLKLVPSIPNPLP
jgi:hypothetical protein